MPSIAAVRPTWNHFALTLLLASAGCGSIDPLALKDREIDELRFDNERRREALLENLDENARQRQSVTDLFDEKKGLLAKNQELTTSLRTTSEQLSAASAQREESRAKLTEVEQSNERLRESLEKVKSVASSSAGELAELRLRRRELEEQGAKLTQSEATLRDENTRLSKELSDARAELVRARAVARSFQESGSVSSQIPAGADGERNLEREIAGLRGENLALLRRIDALMAASGGVSAGAQQPPTGASAASVAAATSGAVYREDPAGLAAEIGSFIKRRYDNALQGKVAWDTFDIVAVGAAGVGLLLFVWGCVRRARMHRLLKDALQGAVRAREAGRAATHAAAAQQSIDSAQDGARARRPTSVRRSSFPGVISAKDVHSEDDASQEGAEAEEVAAPRAEAAAPPKTRKSAGGPSAGAAVGRGEVETLHRVPAEGTSRPSPAPVRPAPQKERAAVDSRKVIGARSWDSDAASGDEPEDDLASTQIIPSLEEEEVLVAHAAPAKAPLLKRAAPPSAPASKPSPRPAVVEPADKSEDKELLAELKSVINRKFDELMK